jgi:F0F1-type ATP synthase membrane subunit b/b'
MSINPSQSPGYMPQASAPPPPATPYTPSPYTPLPVAPASGSSKIGILFGAVVALLAGIGYNFYQVSQLKDQMGKYQVTLQEQLDKIAEANTMTSQSHRRSLEALRDQLEVARRQANMAAGAAKSEALKKVDEAKAELETEQKAALEQTNEKISTVKAAADTANTKIDSVGNDVTAVKGDVATTKTTLEKTIANLQRTQGDVTGQGVLIATNGKELSALRALGERNYVEFTIHKAKDPQKVGDIFVRLEKADPKRFRYTIELTADDKKVEKKDRTINEPLQFLTSKAKQPYELVVNDVKKDMIVGYLSIPKVLSGR